MILSHLFGQKFMLMMQHSAHTFQIHPCKSICRSMLIWVMDSVLKFMEQLVMSAESLCNLLDYHLRFSKQNLAIAEFNAFFAL